MRRFATGTIRRLNLSQSFRFGAEIATLANIVLYTMKRERKAVFGMGKPSSIFIRPDDAPAKRTIICRSNLGIFIVACETRGRKKIFLWGNTKLDLMYYQDLLYLATGQLTKVKSPKVKRFSTVSDMAKHAKVMHDKKLQDDLAFVLSYSGQERELQEKIDKVRACIVNSQDDAEVILTNVHQAKGMEWDCVELADDFCGCFVDTSKGHSLIPYAKEGLSKGKILKLNEEMNILYVALTRARESLVLNGILTQLLAFCTGEYPQNKTNENEEKRLIEFRKAILRLVGPTNPANEERKCANCDSGEMLPTQITVQLYNYQKDYCFFIHQPPTDHRHCPQCDNFSNATLRREEMCTKCLSEVPHLCPDLQALIK